MKKISWRITSNHKKGGEYKEYDKTLYQCEVDEAWVETELPIVK
jgi:hypothetical protein